MSARATGRGGEDSGRRDVPAPTIVGPRPQGGQRGQMTVPRGMERLLTLAGLNEEWRRKAMADPIKTAVEAHIELSPSESTILATLPRRTLAQMILSFARNRLTPVRDTALAAGAAAAALLAATGHGGEAATDGIRPDIPASRAENPPPARRAIVWETSLETALAQAAASARAVMVVCPLGAKSVVQQVGPAGSRGITAEIPASAFLREVCENANAAVVDAVLAADLIAVKPPPGEAHDAYVARLEKYGVSDTDSCGAHSPKVRMAQAGAALATTAG